MIQRKSMRRLVRRPHFLYTRFMKRTAIQEKLFALQDTTYQRFQQRLIPTLTPDRIIGVRTPAVRSFAKEIFGTPEAEKFMLELPHTFFEENNLHAFLIERIKDFDSAVDAIDRFLPYVDNWATCDSMSPKALSKNIPALYKKIQKWVESEKTYTIRFGIEMLLTFFLGEHFKNESLDLVSAIRSEEYYVNMMIAWYFATALAKQYDASLPFIEQKKLDKWTHNKTIQKAIESYRVSDERKSYLRSLKRK